MQLSHLHPEVCPPSPQPARCCGEHQCCEVQLVSSGVISFPNLLGKCLGPDPALTTHPAHPALALGHFDEQEPRSVLFPLPGLCLVASFLTEFCSHACSCSFIVSHFSQLLLLELGQASGPKPHVPREVSLCIHQSTGSPRQARAVGRAGVIIPT